LFVSHNMEAILNLCPKSNVFEKGEIVFTGKSEDSVNAYINNVKRLQTGTQPHVIFERKEDKNSESIFVNKIEVLDYHLDPKPIIYTWDPIIFRTHYYSDRSIKSSSIIIDIYDYKQQRLAVLDSGLQFSLEKGPHSIDCYIPQISFSAGEYFLGVGLAIPNAEFLWRRTNVAVFRISGKDVFNLGRPPASSRMVFAIPHEWKINE